MTERDQEQAIYNAGQQEAKHSEILPLKECRVSQNLQTTSPCGYVSVQGWSSNIKATYAFFKPTLYSYIYPLDV